MAQYNAAQFSRVEIVTQTYVVEGRCGGLTEYQRLIDLLNNTDVTHLQIFAPKVRTLAGAGGIEASDYLFLDKERIIFAGTIETAQEAERRRRAHGVDRVEKDRHDILVFAAPFRISGTAYVVKDADPMIALPRLFNNFLAITQARAVNEHDDTLVWENDFLVVSGRRIEMVLSLSAQTWQALRPQERPAA